MNRIRPKQPRLRLDPESYEQLCQKVLQRDGWRCQACGTTSSLEVHHKQHRSQSVSARRAAAGISWRLEREGFMSPVRSDPPRLRLDPVSYETLRQQVLHRDGWRCQSCGTMSNLEVHHREFRSHSGTDSEENLITLCTACHARVHRR